MDVATHYGIDYYSAEGAFPPSSPERLRRLVALHAEVSLAAKALDSGDVLTLRTVDLVPYLGHPAGYDAPPLELDYRRSVLRDSQLATGSAVDTWGSIRLERPLQTGEAWSQVWTAQVVGSAKPMSPLTIKIYDDTAYPEPDWYSCPEEGSRVWIPSPYAAANEAWVYAHLKDVQGDLVPRSFGFYSTTLPSGKEVVVHLVEFVRGMSMFDYAKSSVGYEERVMMADRVCIATARLHALDIVHGDISPRHLFVVDAHRLVWIDFGLSELADGGRKLTAKTDRSERINIVREILGLESQLVYSLCRHFEGWPWMQDLELPIFTFAWKDVLQKVLGRPAVDFLRTSEAERRRFCPPCRL